MDKPERLYACTRCGEPKTRDQLMVKKAVFLTMGEGGRTIRSRVTDWLCGRCASADPDWNREFNRGNFPTGTQSEQAVALPKLDSDTRSLSEAMGHPGGHYG
jgi:hypothetical protein